jgi:hypothetical protein
MKSIIRNRTSRRVQPFATIAALLALAACNTPAADANPIVFGDAERPGLGSPRGTAPMFAVTPDGREALAWVSAPDGGADGRLYVQIGETAPVELRDSLGPIEGHGEAPPKLVIGPDGVAHAIYVVSRLEEGRRFPASALRYVRSTNNPDVWTAPITVSDNGDFGSHNFHALSVAPDGRVIVSWLDGRLGQSAAYVAVSSDSGRTFAANVRADTTAACPCCRTAVAAATDGTLYMAWRSILPGGIRDIVMARSQDAGATWSEPIPVHADNWEFDGCPHAGPSVRVDPSGRVHVAWWTGREGAAGVQYAVSTDQARSFGEPVALGMANFSRPAHVQLALGGADTVVAVWDDGTVETPQVVLRRSVDGGKSFSPALILSDTSKAATFPVVGLTGRGITVAWSEQPLASLAAAEKAKPDMRDPKAVMGLKSIGDMQVVIRRENR